MKILPFLMLMVATSSLVAAADRQPAKPLLRSTPENPGNLNKVHYPVTVTLAFIVDDTGATRQPLVVHSTNRAFEESAKAAVAKWRYDPGLKGDKAVFTSRRVVFSFTATSVMIASDGEAYQAGRARRGEPSSSDASSK